MTGKIVKGIAGFYYVDTVKGTFECKAKGSFRNCNLKPLVGDNVEIDVVDEAGLIGNVSKILQRKTEMIRPASANVDQALVIFALKSPDPNLNLLDRFLIYMESMDIPSIIVFNKDDISDDGFKDEVRSAYLNAGYPAFFISARENKGIDEIKKLLNGKTSVVAGPSGVGKSTFINLIVGSPMMETGEISRKTERGKHTTRHAELMKAGEDTYIMDTPGFTSLDIFGAEKETLKFFYNEFKDYEGKCRFLDCRHIKEPDCAVKDAVDKGLISKIRYENYRGIYESIREINR